jgi:hypothetical protein
MINVGQFLPFKKNFWGQFLQGFGQTNSILEFFFKILIFSPFFKLPKNGTNSFQKKYYQC